MSELKSYIGDGVYVDYDGYHVVLTTEDGVSVTSRVCLDVSVWKQLLNWYERHLQGTETGEYANDD